MSGGEVSVKSSHIKGKAETIISSTGDVNITGSKVYVKGRDVIKEMTDHEKKIARNEEVNNAQTAEFETAMDKQKELNDQQRDLNDQQSAVNDDMKAFTTDTYFKLNADGTYERVTADEAEAATKISNGETLYGAHESRITRAEAFVTNTRFRKQGDNYVPVTVDNPASAGETTYGAHEERIAVNEYRINDLESRGTAEFGKVRQELKDAEKRVTEAMEKLATATAGVVAMANIPDAYGDGWSMGIGVGHVGPFEAVAIGSQYRKDNFAIKFSGSSAGVAGAGVSWSFR